MTTATALTPTQPPANGDDLAPAVRNTAALAPLTADEVIGQVTLIQQVMQRAMTENEHFGVIPGTNGKPSLLKPGAEKLSMMFRLRPQFSQDIVDLGNEHREYRFVCDLFSPDGTHQGQGVGSCSTMETKYRYRKAEQTCPECGQATIIKGKKEYGGGWVCFKKKGGCGAKFLDGDDRIENQEMGRVEHDNPADYYNTCQKMGKKRAFVDATLTATAASDIFTQDVEDLAANGVMGSAGQPRANGNGRSATLSEDELSRFRMAMSDLEGEYGEEVYILALATLEKAPEDVAKITGRKESADVYAQAKAACEKVAADRTDGGNGQEPEPEGEGEPPDAEPKEPAPPGDDFDSQEDLPLGPGAVDQN